MFRLFDSDYPRARTNIRIPSEMYITRMLSSIKNTYTQYYSTVDVYVPNTHLFVQLLKQIELPPHSTIDDAKIVGRSMLPVLGSMFGVASYVRRGRPVSPGQFYGRNATEVYIGHHADFDKVRQTDAWRAYRPIRVIRHDRSAVDLPYLDGRATGPENEVVVMHVNIGMLAWQYHLWAAWQRDHNPEHARTPQAFVSKVLVPGLIESHLDVVVLNRVINDALGLPNDDTTITRHPFAVANIVRPVARYCRDIAQRVSRERFQYSELLYALPSPWAQGGIMRTLLLPDTLITHQNRWAMLIGYLPYLNFLISLEGVNHNLIDDGYKGILRYRLRVMASEGDVTQGWTGRSSMAGAYIAAELDELRFSLE